MWLNKLLGACAFHDGGTIQCKNVDYQGSTYAILSHDVRTCTCTWSCVGTSNDTCTNTTLEDVLLRGGMAGVCVGLCNGKTVCVRPMFCMVLNILA